MNGSVSGGSQEAPGKHCHQTKLLLGYMVLQGDGTVGRKQGTLQGDGFGFVSWEFVQRMWSLV